MNLDLDEACAGLLRWAECNPMIRALAVFGSRAKGTARAESDLDIAVIVDYENIILDPANARGEKLAEWLKRRPIWLSELKTVLCFDRVHLEELESECESPTVWHGVNECHIPVYDPDGLL